MALNDAGFLPFFLFIPARMACSRCAHRQHHSKGSADVLYSVADFERNGTCVFITERQRLPFYRHADRNDFDFQFYQFNGLKSRRLLHHPAHYRIGTGWQCVDGGSGDRTVFLLSFTATFIHDLGACRRRCKRGCKYVLQFIEVDECRSYPAQSNDVVFGQSFHSIFAAFSHGFYFKTPDRRANERVFKIKRRGVRGDDRVYFAGFNGVVGRGT